MAAPALAPEVVPAPGARLSRNDAKLVAARVAELSARRGELNELLVRDATPERSPLHRFFEWNDAIAGHRHRLAQASYLIRHVRVLIEGAGGETYSVRAFVHLDSQGAGRYLGIQQVLSDETMKQQLLDKALAEAESWRARYQMLFELSGVFRAIETVRRSRGM